jgi:hypothetical protein
VDDEEPRSRSARSAAERALVRIAHHYGAEPEFVVLGGLVPDLLCTKTKFTHAGTTDVDVQVDLEIACGAVNTARLELALRNAEFEPDTERIWRWKADPGGRTIIKFELLADLQDQPTESTIQFDGCERLGAVNLRGTGFAARDIVVRQMTAKVGGVQYTVAVKVTSLAGFLLAKTSAAYSRRKPKDWYDIAFVLLHNDAGGPAEAAAAVKGRFSDDLVVVRTALSDLAANFASPDAQGPRAYVAQMTTDHPDLDPKTLAADAILGIGEFCRSLAAG